MEVPKEKPTALGSVLVIGGCGFLGYHLVRTLSEDPSITCSSIHVLSRQPNVNIVPNVIYHKGDITESTSLPALLSKIAPRIIFHCASPMAYHPGATAAFFQKNIVTATQNIIDAATAEASVLSLIYTSSAVVVAGNLVVKVNEDAPILTAKSKENAYAKAKATADALVRAANNPLSATPSWTKGTASTYANSLRTLVLRPLAIYGERDPVVIAGLLRSFRAGETRFQLGDGTNLFDWLYVGNGARAHVLAAKALEAGATVPNAPKVDGEAFFITDDAPLPFWDFVHLMWARMGDNTPKEKLIVIPTWLSLAIASCAEWVMWIGTLGWKKPALLNRQRVEYSVFERTYSIEKAQKRLQYKALTSTEEGVQRAVEWALEHENELE